MGVNTRQTKKTTIISEITNCLNAMSVDALCDLRNELMPEDVAFSIDSSLFVRSVRDIKQWATSVNLKYKVHNYPDVDMFSYVLNGQQNPYHFDTKQEAMIEAYKDAIRQKMIIESETSWEW